MSKESEFKKALDLVLAATDTEEALMSPSELKEWSFKLAFFIGQGRAAGLSKDFIVQRVSDQFDSLDFLYESEKTHETIH